MPYEAVLNSIALTERESFLDRFHTNVVVSTCQSNSTWASTGSKEQATPSIDWFELRQLKWTRRMAAVRRDAVSREEVHRNRPGT